MGTQLLVLLCLGGVQVVDLCLTGIRAPGAGFFARAASQSNACGQNECGYCYNTQYFLHILSPMFETMFTWALLPKTDAVLIRDIPHLLNPL
jgi:hypothetical protein